MPKQIRIEPHVSTEELKQRYRNSIEPRERSGKVLKGSYSLSEDNPDCEPHKAITLVSAYLVERGLILKLQEVENKSNEITAVPKLIEALAFKGVVFAFDAMNTQKNCGDNY